jgi:hypothetical protein
VVNTPVLSHSAISRYESDEPTSLTVQGQHLFAELDLVCQLEMGLIKSAASVFADSIECIFKRMEPGHYSLDVFSVALDRFIARSIRVQVKTRPVVVSVTR